MSDKNTDKTTTDTSIVLFSRTPVETLRSDAQLSIPSGIPGIPPIAYTGADFAKAVKSAINSKIRKMVADRFNAYMASAKTEK